MIDENIYKNISFCEEDCDYSGIDLVKKTVNCTCKVKKIINTTRKTLINTKGFKTNQLLI